MNRVVILDLQEIRSTMYVVEMDLNQVQQVAA